MRHLLPLLAAACTTVSTDLYGDTGDTAAIDLVGPIPTGEVRAGVVTDPAALVGGPSAEGRPGDIVLVNDRVRFVLQGMRPGNFYVTDWGGIIDADIERDDGVGSDVIEKWTPMVGLGHLLDPTAIEVVSDGSDGGPAVVEVTAGETPLRLLEGVLESPGFVGDFGITATHRLSLPPDSWLMEVTTTVRLDAPVDLILADLQFGAPEYAWTWAEGAGFGAPGVGFDHVAYLSNGDGTAWATLRADPTPLVASGLELLTELADIAIAGGPTIPAGDGREVTFTRYYGVGPDLATLTDAAATARGEVVAPVEGTVTADDGPVAGALVTVTADGAPYTVARTDADGTFTADAPGSGAARAVGWHRARFTDVGALTGGYGPYAAGPLREAAIDALGADPGRVEGRGLATPEAPLTLLEPATLTLTVDDGGPFSAVLRRTTAWDEPDAAFAPPRDRSRAASGWAASGTMTLAVEPGTYDLVVFRGPRHELATERLTLEAGDDATRTLDLPSVVTTPGWLIADPHAHAAPSGDGEISMEDRLLVAAATGVQVHVGTDHDHLADYRPLLAPLGLDGTLASIVADEVSPPLRGHYNIYPVDSDPDASNGGAWLWWIDIPTSMEGIVDALRSRHGDDFVLQSNHPFKSSLAELSGWSPGRIARPSYWTPRFQAVEVINSGSLNQAFDFYLDLYARGLPLTPTGVSDSHGHHGGSPGLSVTYVDVGTDDVTAMSDAAFADAVKAAHVVVSRGPFLDLSITPGTTVAGGADLDVEALSPSWIVVDRLKLLKDGEVVETITGTTATFSLRPDDDAFYVVVAEGDTPMQPMSGNTPWAMSAAIRVDVDDDGWTPPLPSLVVAED